MKASLAAMKQAEAYEQIKHEQTEIKAALLRFEELMADLLAQIEAIQEKLGVNTNANANASQKTAKGAR